MTVLDERPVFYESISKQLEDHYTDHVGDPELGDIAAQQILDNWHDPHYRMALIFALDEFITDMIDAHRVEIQAMLDDADKKVKGQVRKAIMKSYLDNRVQEEISKINGWDESEHPRANSGEFKRKIRSFQGNTGETFDRPLGSGDREEVQRYLAAYSQMTGMPAGHRQRAVFTIQDADGNLRDSQPTIHMPHMGEGERIIHARPLGYEYPHQIGGNVFNVAQAMGADSERAGQAGAVAHQFNQTVNQTDWGKRLSSATRMLYTATGNGANPTKELAAQVAHAVGTHGPEATKVLAPNMRRAAYRYRGLEASPEQLNEVIEGLPVTSTKPDGTTTVQSIQGVENQLANNLRRELPSDQTVQTLLKAGSMPPSRGYIIDKNGKPVTLATGAMDDHYVPFNLRNLGKLNKGSYVRTRAYGGPTTEDMQVALAAGARSFVIESKQGTYRVDFAQRAGTKPARAAVKLPGRAGELYSHLPGNRFGDANTKLVVKRYSRLLDAIQNKKVTATDPETGEDTTLELNGKGYEVALKALQQQFPYLIRNVEFKPAGDQGTAAQGHRAGAGTTDIGYVRPYYLKPSSAAGTYWDPKIETDPSRRGMSFDQMETYRYGVARRNRKAEDARSAAATAAAARPRDEPVDRRAAWERGTQPARGVPMSAAPEVHASATPQGMGERIEVRPAPVKRELDESEQDEWENWVFDVAGPRLEHLPDAEDSRILRDVLRLRNKRRDSNAEYLDWRADHQSSPENRDELEREIDGALQLDQTDKTGIEPPPRFEARAERTEEDMGALARAEEDDEPAPRRSGQKWTKASWRGSANQRLLGKARGAAAYFAQDEKIQQQGRQALNPGQLTFHDNFEKTPSKPDDLTGLRAPADWWRHARGANMLGVHDAVVVDPAGNTHEVSPFEFFFQTPEPFFGDQTPFEHYSDVDNAIMQGKPPRYDSTEEHIDFNDPDLTADNAMREIDRDHRD